MIDIGVSSKDGSTGTSAELLLPFLLSGATAATLYRSDPSPFDLTAPLPKGLWGG